MKRIDEVNLVRWFKDKFKKVANKVKGSSIKAGRFYSFKYDSKLYENDLIPYYDESPLILCLGENENYVLGLNFHYIPSKHRVRVINRLKKRYKKEWDANKILSNVSWNTVRSELKYATFMVKLYIKGRLRTPIVLENKEMEKAIKIPSSNFIGISADKLWKSLGL